MKSFAKKVFLVASAVRLLPHLFLYHLSRNNTAIKGDLERWITVRHLNSAGFAGTHISFLKLMTWNPEYRNIFYHRIGIKGKLFSFLCPPMSTLYIYTGKIGPALFIQHGFATIISAKAIGANCWINQQVTIGFSNDTDQPTLLDNVTVNAGAKIIGDVVVGPNSIVGANAVVVKDVPANVTVVGVPARIVRRNGMRVDELL